MKSTVSLVLPFFLCIIGYAQHISEFESFPSVSQDEKFHHPIISPMMVKGLLQTGLAYCLIALY